MTDPICATAAAMAPGGRAATPGSRPGAGRGGMGGTAFPESLVKAVIPYIVVARNQWVLGRHPWVTAMPRFKGQRE